MRNDFVILIISHGRPNDILTIDTLNKAGSDYPYYIVIDNHDNTADEYYNKYGEKVKEFDKDLYASKVDHYDNFNNLRTTTHARNACFDIAEQLGYKYFLVLDDDYTSFKFRINHELNHPDSCPNLKRDLGKVFELTLNYYINTNFTSICFSQGGDWFGGGE